MNVCALRAWRMSAGRRAFTTAGTGERHGDGLSVSAAWCKVCAGSALACFLPTVAVAVGNITILTAMESKTPTILLVTGGRDYSDRDCAWGVLDSIARYHPGFALVQGGARGADALAKAWAVAHGHPSFTCDANWDYYGNRRAGPIRNGWMATFMRPSFVLHFPGGTGTADMVKRARSLGIPCYPGVP